MSKCEKDIKTPFFSIIIPVFNADDYLQECLESILSQDFQDLEIVLVDDGSSDRSVEIAEEFARNDTRIKIFKSEENSGSAYSPRMKAAELATGAYLITIDADDKVADNYFNILHKAIETHNPDLVTTEMWTITEKETKKLLPAEWLNVDKIWDGEELIDHTLRWWDISMNGFAIKRYIYLDANSHITEDDKKSIFADELLSRWLLFMSKRVAMCDARYYYRQHDASITHANILRIIDSTMMTCDSLISMTSTVFGNQSPTHINAIDNKFRACVDSLRQINKSKLSRNQRSAATQAVAAAIVNSDFTILKGKVSRIYLTIMQLPTPIARTAFKFLDPLIKLKNGI